LDREVVRMICRVNEKEVSREGART
jgi:hypothetical protein